MWGRSSALAVCLLAFQAQASPSLADANVQLDALYQQLKNQPHTDDNLRKRMINAQRAWRAFRDAECEYVTAIGEGSAVHIENYEHCAQALTTARIDALQRYLQCTETETDCAVAGGVP